MTSTRTGTLAANNFEPGDYLDGVEVISMFSTGGNVHFTLEDGTEVKFPAQTRTEAIDWLVYELGKSARTNVLAARAEIAYADAE